jgi:hypothetical protein
MTPNKVPLCNGFSDTPGVKSCAAFALRRNRSRQSKFFLRMHASDIILLPPYAGGLLVWPVFWIVSRNRGALFWELAKVFAWTAAGLAALAAGQWLTGVLSSARIPLINLFPVVNLVSLMASAVPFFGRAPGAYVRFSSEISQRWWESRGSASW